MSRKLPYLDNFEKQFKEVALRQGHKPLRNNMKRNIAIALALVGVAAFVHIIRKVSDAAMAGLPQSRKSYWDVH